MTQQINTGLTKFEDSQVANVQGALEDIKANSMRVRYDDKIPTINTLKENEFVVYDDGAGTKRLYTITRKGNLGFIALT